MPRAGPTRTLDPHSKQHPCLFTLITNSQASKFMFSNSDVSFALGNSETWTAAWIVGICVILTYYIAVQEATQDHRKLERSPIRQRHPNKSPLAEARKVKAAKLRAQSELDKRHGATRVQKPFQFMNLPEEICLLVLSQCDDWNATYRALVLVSRDIQRLTLEAYLPRMPIILLTIRACTIFGQFLFTHSEAESLVRHLFIRPQEDTATCTVPCTTILLRCKNIRSLACTPAMLYLAMRRGEAGMWNHNNCTDLTLLPNGEQPSAVVYLLPDIKVIRTFLERLTHLRVPSEDYYHGGVCFTRLTHLSIRIVAPIPKTAQWIEKEVLSDVHRYPALRTAVVTLKQKKLQEVRITKKKDRQFFCFEVPERWTEVEIWRQNVQERGIWDLAKNWKAFRQMK